MVKADVLIAGGGQAGLAALRTIRALRPEWEVVVVKPERGFMSRCVSRYYVKGEIEEKDILFDDGRMFRGAEVVYAKVTGGRYDERCVELDNNEKVPFKKLILATGSTPRLPNIPGVDHPNIYTVRYFEDVRAIAEVAKESKSAAIVGASYVALDFADCLTRLGLEVSLIARSRVLRASLDEDFSAIVEEHLSQHGVKVINGNPAKILGKDKTYYVKLDNGAEVQGDFIIFAIGARPVIEPAARLGVAVGSKGVIVDDRMETSLRDVYAVGEIAEVRNLVSGEPMAIGTAAAAMAQGEVAGYNICGHMLRYPGGLPCLVAQVFDLYVGSVGLTVEQALQTGFKPVAEEVEFLDHYTNCPGGKKYWSKVVYDAVSGRIIGSQFLGFGNVADKVEAAALAIRFKATAAELMTHYSAAFPAATYNPRFNQFRETAQKVIKKLNTRAMG